jgi:prevent-host-death family protein
MEEIAISEFKAKCLAILERVRVTKRPIRVTRHGKPIAEVVAPSPGVNRADLMDAMKGEMKFIGDIVSPANDDDEWEVERD